MSTAKCDVVCFWKVSFESFSIHNINFSFTHSYEWTKHPIDSKLIRKRVIYFIELPTANERNVKPLSATDVLAPTTMKNAAKCDTSCELQNLVSHQVFERNLRSLVEHVCWSVCFIPTSESIRLFVPLGVGCRSSIVLLSRLCHAQMKHRKLKESFFGFATSHCP